METRSKKAIYLIEIIITILIIQIDQLYQKNYLLLRDLKKLAEQIEFH